MYSPPRSARSVPTARPTPQSCLAKSAEALTDAFTSCTGRASLEAMKVPWRFRRTSFTATAPQSMARRLGFATDTGERYQCSANALVWSSMTLHCRHLTPLAAKRSAEHSKMPPPSSETEPGCLGLEHRCTRLTTASSSVTSSSSRRAARPWLTLCSPGRCRRSSAGAQRLVGERRNSSRSGGMRQLGDE